jgi:uncharacterized membrane protein (UPF0127 family)
MRERIMENWMNPFRWIATELQKYRSSRQATSDIKLRVSNLTRDTVLATHMEVADSGPRRSKGLLGRNQLAPGEGMWIVPCESVHTFWMRFAIDLIYLDRKRRIRKLVSSVPPWRLSGCIRAHSVMELPSGTIRATQTQLGDALEFLEFPSTEDNSATEA